MLSASRLLALIPIAALSSFASAEESENVVQAVGDSGQYSITGSSRRSITGSSRRSIGDSDEQSITGSSRRSITGSSRRSIDENDELSITGSSRRSITGSSRRSITGSSRRSIDGSDEQSITGSSRRSITGSSRRSIDGSDAQSITGSSRRSITGSSRRSIGDSDEQSITGSSRRSITGSSRRSADVLLYGPVTATGDGTISVLGTALKFTSAVGTDAIGRAAYVEASQSEGELEALAVILFDELSVPGASIVLVSGKIEQRDSVKGTVKLAGATVDFSAVQDFDFEPGEWVTVTGTQPVPGGVILATEVRPSDRSVLTSVEADLNELNLSAK